MNHPLTEEHLLLRKKIRSQMRENRRLLSHEKQKSATQSVTQHMLTHEKISRAQHLGIFLSFDGEIDTQAIIEYLWQKNKKVYVPIVDPALSGHLLFVPYHQGTILVSNSLNIPEPSLDSQAVMPFGELDIVFVPLVAFDRRGQRLGMGGGFYDRILQKNESPYPIGLAHDCQLVEDLPVTESDIPLPEIITPGKIWQWQ